MLALSVFTVGATNAQPASALVPAVPVTLVPSSVAGAVETAGVAGFANGAIVAGAGLAAFYGSQKVLGMLFPNHARGDSAATLITYCGGGTGNQGGFVAPFRLFTSNTRAPDVPAVFNCGPSSDSPGQYLRRLEYKVSDSCGGTYPNVFCNGPFTVAYAQDFVKTTFTPGTGTDQTYADCLGQAGAGCTLTTVKGVQPCGPTTSGSPDCSGFPGTTNGYTCTWGTHTMPISDCVAAFPTGSYSPPTVATTTRVEYEPACSPWTYIAKGDASGGGTCYTNSTTSQLATTTISVPAGQTGVLKVYGYCGNAATFGIVVDAAASVPAIMGCATGVPSPLLFTSGSLAAGSHTIGITSQTAGFVYLDYYERIFTTDTTTTSTPTPTPTSSGTGRADTRDGVTDAGTGTAAGTDASSDEAGCLGSWTWNPVAWVLRPVKCALQAVFVPSASSRAAVSADLSTLSTAVPFGYVGQAGGLVTAAGADASGACNPGPTFAVLGFDFQPVNLCSGTLHDALVPVRPYLTAGMWLAILVPIGMWLFRSSVPVIGSGEVP